MGFTNQLRGARTWTAIAPTGLPADIGINSLTTTSTALFAATTGHIYKSSDNGNTWTEVSSGIPATATVTSMVANASAVFAGSDSSGVLCYDKRRHKLDCSQFGSCRYSRRSARGLGTRLLAVTLNGVFVSDNNGTTWAADSSSLKNINCFLATNGQLLAGTDNSGVYLSIDSGATWTSFNSGMPDSTRVWSLAAGSDSIFAGTDSGVWRSPTTPNSAPTVATAASANPNPVTGIATSLSVLGADDGGEANLTYTWATTGTPPAAVSFSANGSNAAKNTTATFSQAGSYTLQVTVKDQLGLTATSTVAVTVNQTLTSIGVAPASSTIAPLATQQFVATARDQFGTALGSQPSFTWSVSGGGTIDGNGLFTASASTGGPYTVTASSGGFSGTATVSVAVPNAAPTIATAAAASPNPVIGSTTALSVLGADDGGEANLTYTWATSGTPPASVGFSANGTNAAKNTTATFTKAGSYTFQVTIKDQGNLTATSSVVVTVNPTLTTIVVSPSSATVNTSATQQFSATARDQFATGLATQPTFTWSASGGGTISSTGLFTAGTSAGGPYTVTAQSGGISGTASITVTPATVYQINCGGSAASPYTADQYYSGGTARTVTNSITTTGVTNPAPQAVYQVRTVRRGNVYPSEPDGRSFLHRTPALCGTVLDRSREA